MIDVPRSWSELTPTLMTVALGRRFPGAVVSELELVEIVEGTNSRARVLLRYAAGGGPERVFVKREGKLLHRLALIALGASCKRGAAVRIRDLAAAGCGGCAHERELLQGYLDALGASGATPPSLRTAWESYRATPAFGLCTWLHTFSVASFQPDAVCLATIARFAAAYIDLETNAAPALAHLVGTG